MPDHQFILETLCRLIEIPSLSQKEDESRQFLLDTLLRFNVQAESIGNNVWAVNKYYNPGKPTLLLNSHHDTVPPSNGYSRNPYNAEVTNGKVFGLGSNDAGGSLICLLATFLHFYPQENLPWNILFLASAEEEISGHNGIALAFPLLEQKYGKISFAIIGEPTEMHLAIAEKGLIVLNCTATGKSGHAARNEGENAIYKALKDIQWFQTFKFDRISEMLGEVKMTVTVIHSGERHNIVPDVCDFTVDIRTTEMYSNHEIIEIISSNISSEVRPRSLRLQPSSIDVSHAIVQSGIELGRNVYGSPTLSDQSLISIPSLKIGPGFSGRSHTADEFIYFNELIEGYEIYKKLLTTFFQKDTFHLP